MSSSGHLVLVPSLLGWADQGLAFDVGLHIGTLIALLGYFWREWRDMLSATVTDLSVQGWRWQRYSANTMLLMSILIGTLPVAAAGLFFGGFVESRLRTVPVVSVALIVGGFALIIAERLGSGRRRLTSVAPADGLFIGLAQALALVPGVSRSGATITAGLSLDIERGAAARFAFLLGTPAFLAAAVLELPQARSQMATDWRLFAVGVVSAAVSGALVIRWMFAYLRQRTFLIFGFYRVVVGMVALCLWAWGR